LAVILNYDYAVLQSQVQINDPEGWGGEAQSGVGARVAQLAA
jgi:hypothetical protein